MNFGTWILRKRKEQELTISEVAERTGVDVATISRVETEKAQVTLGTAVRLCEGIHVSLADLVHALLGKTLLEQGPMVKPDEQPVLTMEDVEVFLEEWRYDEQESRRWLAHLLNGIIMQRGEAPKLFTPEDIEKLLVDNPLYCFEVQYPTHISMETLIRICRCGGVLTLHDLLIYTKRLSQERREEIIRFSTNALSRLETGALERMKLREIVLLDEQFQQDGILLAMYWKVYLFDEIRESKQKSLRPDMASAWTQREAIVISVFITICRWLQTVSRDDTWVKDVRSRMRRGHQLQIEKLLEEEQTGTMHEADTTLLEKDSM